MSSLIARLSRQQLDAYNRADLDAFCGAYHPDVQVLDAEGDVVREKMVAFRAGYGEMFLRYRDVAATVSARLELDVHIVELEHWSRVDRTTGERLEGDVLVRYTEQDGLIRWAQFLRPRP